MTELKELCYKCGEFNVDDENGYLVVDADGRVAVCESCYYECYTECDRCGYRCPNEDMGELDDGMVCDECMP